MQVEQPIASYNGNPQTEDGFTMLAHELLEAICLADLSKRQYKVLLAIARKTYGYGKKTDDITCSQISKMTGLAISHVSSTIKELTDRKILLSDGNGSYGKILSINKIYDLWVTKTVSYQNGNVTKTVTEGYQNGNKGLPKRSLGVTKTVNTIDNSNIQLQYKTPIDKPDHVPDEIWKDWLALRKAKKAPVTVTALKGIEREAAKAGISLKDALQVSCTNGWQGFKAEWIRKDLGPPKSQSKADRFNAAMDKAFGTQETQIERDITALTERLD